MIKIGDNFFIGEHKSNLFWDKVSPEPNTGCWLWNASCDSSGYGTFHIKGKTWSTHKLSYVAEYGLVPKGLEIHHLCEVTQCCNPNHLKAVTHKENVLLGRGPTAINKRKTHCPKGHLYGIQNTYRQANNGRICRTCAKTHAVVNGQKRKLKISSLSPGEKSKRILKRISLKNGVCSKGHKLTPETVKLNTAGYIRCLACKRAYERNYRRGRD